MTIEQIAYSQFDRFFYKPEGSDYPEYRCRLIGFDPRHNTFTIQFYGGGRRDGETLHGVDRRDIRFHWDVPKGHADW